MLLKVLPDAGGLVSEAAESSHSVCNGEGEATADVGWMGAAGQQKLANFSRLLIQISLDESIPINPNVDVQEVDSSCAEVVVEGELDGGVEVVAVHHELLQLLLRPLPDEKDVINVSPPHVHCCSDPGCQHASFQPAHEDASKSWSHPRPHSSAIDLEPER